MAVGKSDQLLVPAAVVPEQLQGGQGKVRFLQDGIAQGRVVHGVVLFGVSGLLRFGGKEIRGRHLPGVPGDDGLAAAEDRADGVLGKDLGRFVENDHVEMIKIGIQEIGNGQGRHHETGLELHEQIGDMAEQLAQGHDLGPLGQLLFQDRHFTARRLPGHPVNEHGLEPGAVDGKVFLAQAPELPDIPFRFHGVKARHVRTVSQGLADPGKEEGLFVRPAEGVKRNACLFKRGGGLSQAFRGDFPPLSGIAHPFVQVFRVVRRLGEAFFFFLLGKAGKRACFKAV